MNGLDGLKALLQKKRQETQDLVGDKKYVRKSELEEAKLKRLREEEEQERRAKEEKKRRFQGAALTSDGRPSTPVNAADAAPAVPGADYDAISPGGAAEAAAALLPKEEVIRRLRALGQPVTLFGEEDADRLSRLRKVEKTVALVDEARGGQQENVLLAIKRQEKMSRKQTGKATEAAAAAPAAPAAASGGNKAANTATSGGGAAAAAGAGAAAVAGAATAGHDGPTTAADSEQAAAAAAAAGDVDGSAAAAAGTSSNLDQQGTVMAAFQEAAARLAQQRAEEALPIEERMIQLLQSWCQQWEEDLEARSDEVKMSGMGNQATMVFKQSMTYFEPLYERLRRRQLQEELKVGLWMMVSHMRDRNYLAASDIYLKLAIGNAPWPIGVTHVGLHERSAREKISHVMNSSSQAHIMNDEATRKYFQAIKRLMTNLQRLRPTDPSRSVDFDVHGDEGRGSAGAGSNRQALLEAQAKGELPLALPAAPHSMAPDGSVKIPPKWEHVLQQQIKQVSGAKTPPKTPPRSPLVHQ